MFPALPLPNQRLWCLSVFGVLQAAPVSATPPPLFSARCWSCVKPPLCRKILLALSRKYHNIKPIRISWIGKRKDFSSTGETLVEDAATKSRWLDCNCNSVWQQSDCRGVWLHLLLVNCTICTAHQWNSTAGGKDLESSNNCFWTIFPFSAKVILWQIIINWLCGKLMPDFYLPIDWLRFIYEKVLVSIVICCQNLHHSVKKNSFFKFMKN